MAGKGRRSSPCKEQSAHLPAPAADVRVPRHSRNLCPTCHTRSWLLWLLRSPPGGGRDVEHTSEELCMLRRLQPARLSNRLWCGTSSSLLPWESRHSVPSAVLSPCTEPVSGNSDYRGTVWKQLSLYIEVQILSWSCRASWGTSMAAGLGREGDIQWSHCVWMKDAFLPSHPEEPISVP